MSEASELKKLQTSLRSIDESLADANKLLADTKTKVSDLTQKRNATNQKILSFRGLKVSEHALLRMCERKFGIPIDKVEEQLKQLIEPILKGSTAGKFPIGDGLRAVVTNKTLVTVELT